MIKLVTDSTAYLNEAVIRQHDINVVPLYVHFGDRAFREGVDLGNEESYALLKEAAELPTTGGRIGNAKAFLGTLLKVKPILVLQDGAIEPLEQVRSKRKALARMLDLIKEHVGAGGCDAKVGLANALVHEEVQALGQEIQARLGCAEPFVSNLGPVIGAHTGPGVIGIAAYV